MIPVIMTVDTEGDNLWSWKKGNNISTSNASFISPFQDLCEKYAIVPVYLTNYEMAMSNEFVQYIKIKAQNGLCEIGMHLHAWNSPPNVRLDGPYSGNPYITEYNKNDIFNKHLFLKDLIIQRFGITPVSYRAGRWATNEDLFDVLEKLGFLIDCSVTPGINHKAPGVTVQYANDYTNANRKPYKLREHLWEIPMTTDLKRSFKGNSIKRKVINIVRGEQRWLRPALLSTAELREFIKDTIKANSPYIMFMIHSSELMPGGSPYCANMEDVQNYLSKLENIFISIKDISKGYSLKDYYKILEGDRL